MHCSRLYHDVTHFVMPCFTCLTNYSTLKWITITNITASATKRDFFFVSLHWPAPWVLIWNLFHFNSRELQKHPSPACLNHTHLAHNILRNFVWRREAYPPENSPNSCIFSLVLTASGKKTGKNSFLSYIRPLTCKNIEIISHLAKIIWNKINMKILQAFESKKRPTWSKTFVCLHPNSTYWRPWGDTRAVRTPSLTLTPHFAQHCFNSARLTMSAPFIVCIFYSPSFLSPLTRQRGGRSRSYTSFRWSSAGGLASVNPSVTFNRALCCSDQYFRFGPKNGCLTSQRHLPVHLKG